MSPSNPLQSLRDLDRTSPHFHNQLIDLLRGNGYRDVIPTLKGGGLVWLVNYLDNVSLYDVPPIPHSPLAQVLCEISDSSSVPFREPLDELKRICGISNVLPKACTLSDSLLGCVYEGTFNGSKVRVRRVRTHPKGDPQKVKEVCTPRHVFRLPGAHRPQTFHQVAVVWKHSRHPNIVPLLGVTLDPPQLISDRMPGGDLTEYITSHPDTDRISLVSDLSTSLYETLTPSSAVWCRRGSQTFAFA